MDRLDGIAEVAEIIRLVEKYLQLDNRGKGAIWGVETVLGQKLFGRRGLLQETLVNKLIITLAKQCLPIDEAEDQIETLQIKIRHDSKEVSA